MTAPSPAAADLARKLELSLWRPDATAKDVERLCARAREQKLHGVCVAGSRVELAAALLEDSDVKVTALIGFPLGTTESDVKRYEAEAAIDCGAHEIEIVLNAGKLKDGDHKYVLRELRDLAEAADERPVKLILETQLLSREEVLLVCELAVDSGVHFVCAGTGLNGAAKVEDVKLLREAVGAKFGVKAPGDIRDVPGMVALIAAGADRMGISS